MSEYVALISPHLGAMECVRDSNGREPLQVMTARKEDVSSVTAHPQGVIC
jgi:hypothetical protein